MKRIISTLLALIMILSTASFAAPVMTGTVNSASETTDIKTDSEIPKTVLSAERKTYHETYGTLVYDIDFETDAEYKYNTYHKISAHGFVNPEFAGFGNFDFTSGAGVDSSEKHKESNGNTVLKLTNKHVSYPQLNVRAGTASSKFSDALGHYTVTADVKINISGKAGADFNGFATRFNYYYKNAENVNTMGTKDTTYLKPKSNGGTWEDGSWASYQYTCSITGTSSVNYDYLNSILYIFWYKAAPTTYGVDDLYIDNVRLYYKPFSKTLTVDGGNIAEDKTLNINIGSDLDSTVTKAELMNMLSYGDDIRLVNLTLADGSAFESIDVVKVSEIKAVLENINRYDKTYGHLVFKMDFETGKAYESSQSISAQGFVNSKYTGSYKWYYYTNGYTTTTETENNNTFLRFTNKDSKFPQLVVNSNGTLFTGENGYFTVSAKVRRNISGKAVDASGNPVTCTTYFSRANFRYYDSNAAAQAATDQVVITEKDNGWQNNSWKTVTDTLYVKEYKGFEIKGVPDMIFPFQYSAAPSNPDVDSFDIDNVIVYFKPYSENVTVLAGTNTAFENQTVTVDIDKDLDSTITKSELMAKITNNTDLILADLVLADGSAFDEIDVMLVNEVKAVWLALNPESYDVASIRVNAPSGIRFLASVTEQQKTNAAEYGFIVTIARHLGENNADSLKIDSNINKVIGESYGYDSKIEKNVDRIFKIENNNIFFTAALHGIPESKANYEEDIIVRPYLKDENGVYHYAEPIVRSVLETALAIQADNYDGLNQDGILYVDRIINLCSANS